MKVLLVGVGGVGEAIAVIAKDRPWLEQMVLATTTCGASGGVCQARVHPRKFAVERIDAGDREQVVALARKYGVDLIMNAVDPVFNEQIFDAAFEAGCNYMDMAMTLSDLHPTNPYQECGVKLGDYQFERAQAWEQKGLLALVGMGVEPGMADVFARYAEKHLFDEIEEIGIRDGANLEVRGYEFAPNFSIWTTIEECLNPPVIWEKERGWFTTAPFSEPEVFEFPEGSARWSASTWSTRRCCWSRAGSSASVSRSSTAWAISSSACSRRSRCSVWTTRTRSRSRASRWHRATWWRPVCPTRRTWATGCSARRARAPG